jgi:WD40 repeat protein
VCAFMALGAHRGGETVTVARHEIQSAERRNAKAGRNGPLETRSGALMAAQQLPSLAIRGAMMNRRFQCCACLLSIIAGWIWTAAPAQCEDPFPIAEHAVWSEHGDAVYGLAFLSNSDRLASGSYDKTIKLWDTTRGQVMVTMQGHQDQVFRISVPTGGNALLSCSGDGSAIRWNLATGEQARKLVGHGDPMMAVVSSRDGKRVATAGFHIQLWEDGKEQWSTPHAQPSFALTFAPDQQTLACGTENRVRFLKVGNGEPVADEIETAGMVYQLEYSPDGKWLAIASGAQLSLWDVAAKKLHRSVKADASALFAATFLADGKHLATGGRERVVRVWTVPDLSLAAELYGPAETILSLAVSASGDQVVAGVYDGTIHRWSRASR